MTSWAWAAFVTFCHLVAVFVGSVEPGNAGVKGPDRPSPCIFSDKHVLGWHVLPLGSFVQDRAPSVPSSVPYTQEPVLTNWLHRTGQE